MDGLMFNTEDLYDKVGEVLLQRRDQHFTRELKLEMMGLPGPTAFQIMKDRCQLSDTVEGLQTECDAIFQDMLPAEIEMMPGLESLLELIESKSLPKCVCTSSHRQFAKRSLGFFDLESRFEFILTSDDVTNGKPHPEVYLTAAKKLKVDPANMLVLEDSRIGSTAAVAAGAFTVAVPTKHSHGLDFSHVNAIADGLADNVISSLFEIT
jgi:HAD superfamily hydrolase (TIGR01509 family)